jgi:hypothetical protein
LSIIEIVNKELLSTAEYLAVLYNISGKPVQLQFDIGGQTYVLGLRPVVKTPAVEESAPEETSVEEENVEVL